MKTRIAQCLTFFVGLVFAIDTTGSNGNLECAGLSLNGDSTSHSSPPFFIQNKNNPKLLSDTITLLPDKAWKVGGNGNLNFAQGYVSYWAEGGESSISGIAVFNLFAKYKKGKTKWENTFNVKYGLLKSGENKLRKNEDRFEVNSKFGRKAYHKFYYSIGMGLKSQLDRGYEFPNDSVVVSNFMSPGYIVTSIGIDYKPTDNLSILMSPLTSKITIIHDKSVDELKFGLEKGETVKRETGAYIKTIYKVDLTEDISIENELDFFTSYLDQPENVDVNWEVKISLKVNDHIKTTINTHLVYDDNIQLPIERTRLTETGELENYKGTTKKIQFKELLSVGFTYQF